MSGAISDHTAAALTLSGVSAERGGRTLFAGLSLDLRAGDLLWVTGDNGIGKTTLLRVMAGLLAPSAGDVSGEQNAAFLEYAGHASHGLTAAEDFAFWAKIYGVPASAEDALKAVGLGGHLGTRTQSLSTGQAKRLGLAKLSLSGRKVWLMDEPSAGLDPSGRAFVRDMLSAHLRSGGIAGIASHMPLNVPNVAAKKLVLEAAE